MAFHSNEVIGKAKFGGEECFLGYFGTKKKILRNLSSLSFLNVGQNSSICNFCSFKTMTLSELLDSTQRVSTAHCAVVKKYSKDCQRCMTYGKR